MKQQTLAMAADQSGYEQYRKPTRREEFLKTMEAIVPWAALCVVIEPYYPKAGNGRPPIGLERMLRIHFIQHWFNLADLACEETLYDSASLRRFVGIDLGREPVPDATTLLKFRRLLNDNKLSEALFAKVGQEPQQVAHPLAGGARVRRGQATVGLWQSALPRPGQERHVRIHGTGSGQHLPWPTAADGTGAPLRATNGPRGPKHRPNGLQEGTLGGLFRADRPLSMRSGHLPGLIQRSLRQIFFTDGLSRWYPYPTIACDFSGFQKPAV